MGLDLGEEDHLPAVGDGEVRRLPGVGHQLAHHDARLLDEARPAEEGAADAERLLPDEPQLRRRLHLDDPVRLKVESTR